MPDKTPKTSRGAPRKQFYIPPDIARLGSYAVAIIESMKREHKRRITG
jgi:hypothetical protein